MDWSHQTVLVTGAGGFIGSHLTERLVTLGARTRALVRYNSAGSWGWLEASPHRDGIQSLRGGRARRGQLACRSHRRRHRLLREVQPLAPEALEPMIAICREPN